VGLTPRLAAEPLPELAPSSRVTGRPPWVLAGAAFGVYLLYALTRFRTGHDSAYDLGIFVQIVSRYAHLQAPVIGIKLGTNAMGDHFSPALVVLAPFYRLVPRPETLLVAQAALAAVSIVPVTRVARAITGPRAGVLVGLAYAGSYGLQSMIGFDFHEVALAVPLLAFGLEAYLDESYTRAAVLVGLLVFVKEDLGLTVVLFAAVLALRGQRRIAAVLVAWAVTWFVLAIAVIVPALSPQGTFRYLESLKSRGGLHLTPAHLLTLAETDGRWHLVWLLVVTGVVVALRSPLSALALGTLSWRLLSIGPGYMDTHVHYDAVLMPIVFMAALDGVRLLARRPLVLAYPYAVLAVVVVTTLAAYPFPRLLHPHFYQARPEVAEVQRLTAHVPRGARLRTDNDLAPLVVSNYDVTMVYAANRNLPLGEWLMLDVSACSLNAPRDWKLAYLRALAPYTEQAWLDGRVELVRLRPGAPVNLPDPYPVC
jgi:uncharacterized membrane protein